MDKRKNDRLSVNQIKKELVNLIVDMWVDRCIMAIKYQRSLNIKQELIK